MAQRSHKSVSSSEISSFDWRDRVLRLERLYPQDLADHPLQHKIHPEFQHAVLRGILTEVGIADVLRAYVSPMTGQMTLVDGHLRKSLGHQPWPTLILDVNDEEAAYLLLTYDEITKLALRDLAKTSSLLHQVTTSDAAVTQMLREMEAAQSPLPRAPQAVRGENDPVAEWQGLPAFHQEDQLGWKSLIVHFETPEDLTAFAALVQQPLTERTRFMWYPAKAPVNLQQYRFIDES